MSTIGSQGSQASYYNFSVGSGIQPPPALPVFPRENPTDPFGLRTTYAHEPKVIRVLADIERAITSQKPGESLDLSGLNLSPLSNKQTPDRTLIHLERLIIKMGNSQYPLESANLTRTNLTGIDLTRAILPEANLTEAILTGTNLWRANLYEADLRGAVVVSNGQTITGEELKQYLLETFKVTLSEGAKF